MKDYAPIAAVTFQLQGSRTARIRQQEDSDRRRTQPLSECSAGSVFTNASEFGVAAAELIEKKVSE
ncbi:hypothetical protein POPTR_017G115002v4 [Populus trichocarpa]|uniref:Uncharacterized protein n=1 Tax=Populus trichocarpa TaxID=3694 RepID=A0ACC0RRJ8_POPTR|nr:hypothetical protein POPTR_017G115002v4 [Populus trichocarpa]